MSQLERDLKNRVDDKLHQWLKDSLDLYEMAELKGKAAIGISEVLLRCVAAGFVANGFTDEQACQCLIIAMERARLARARVAKSFGFGDGP